MLAAPTFDVPTIHTSWANLCTKCLPKWGGRNKDIGFKLVKVNKVEPQDPANKTKAQREKEFAASFDMEDQEVLHKLIMDSIQPTACSEGCEVEPDGHCPHGYSSISILLGII